MPRRKRKKHEILEDMELDLSPVNTNAWRDRQRLLKRKKKQRLREEETKTLDDINRRWSGKNFF